MSPAILSKTNIYLIRFDLEKNKKQHKVVRLFKLVHIAAEYLITSTYIVDYGWPLGGGASCSLHEHDRSQSACAAPILCSSSSSTSE